MKERGTGAQAVGLVGWLVVVFIAAACAGIASVHAAEFYAQLVKPSWAPSAGVFGPVWSVLYTLMGIAAWVVWRETSGRGKATAIGLFIVQLVVNALWSWLFFAWHLGAASFVDVLVLLALVTATLVLFWRIRPLAGMLLVPYLCWVCLASALTWSVWQNNPVLLG